MSNRQLVPNNQTLFLKNLQYLLIFIFLVILVLAVLQQANPLNTKLGRDSGIYLYVSNTFLKGGLPYVSAMETKPPGIFFIDALALWIGKGTRWGVWLVEFVFLILTTGVSFYLFYRQFGFGPALVGSVVWLSGLNLTLEGGNLTEEYSLLFGFSALLLWIVSENSSRRFWLDVGIGLCTGFSALLRPNNVGVQFAIILAIVFFHVSNKQFRILFIRLFVIGGIALIPWIIAGLYFYIRGAFTEFLNASIVYNLFYTGGNFSLRNSLIGGAGSLGFLFGIGTIGYFVAISYLQKKEEFESMQPFLLWLVLDGILEVIFSSLSGKSFQHYYICWLPFIGSATAVLTYFVFPNFCQWSAKYPIGFTWLSIVIVLLWYPNLTVGYIESSGRLLFSQEKNAQYSDPVVEYVNWRTVPGDFVLVWGGQAGINFLSNRISPTPYIFYPLLAPSPVTDEMSIEYFQSIREHPPGLIVDGSSFSPDIIPLHEVNPQKWLEMHNGHQIKYLVEVLNFIRNNYRRSTVIDGVKIYELKK
jgi:hypothetical protein